MASNAWKNKVTLEKLIAFLHGPDPAEQQLGDFSRCVSFLCGHYPKFIGYAFDPDELSKVVQPYLNNRGSSSYYKGRTKQYFRYMALAPEKNAEYAPDSINIIRAMLLVVLAYQHFRRTSPQTPLTDDQARAINTLLGRWSGDGIKVKAFYQQLSTDQDPAKLAAHWLDEISNEPNFVSNRKGGKNRNEALDALLNSFLWIAANETSLYLEDPPSCDSSRLSDATDQLVNGASPGESPVLIPPQEIESPEESTEGQPFDSEEQGDRSLTSSIPVPNDEQDISRSLDRARAIQGREQWVNNLFLQSGDNALTGIEAEKSVSTLLAQFRSSYAAKDIIRCEAIAATMLVLITSCSIHYVVELPDLDYFDKVLPNGESAILKEGKEAAEGISIQRGVHLFRIPDADKFCDAPVANPLYKKTSSRMQLQLPWKMHLVLHALRRLNLSKGKHSLGYLFRTPYKTLHQGIMDLTLNLRNEGEIPRFTIERLRNFLPFELYSQNQDVAVVQFVTGQTFGLSTAPLHYWQAKQSTLQKMYDCALKDVFPPAPKKWRLVRHRYEIPSYVGSRLQLPDEEIQAFTAQLRKLSAHQTRPRKQLATWLTNFNQLTRFNAFHFLAGTGHRHTYALSVMTLHDLDLSRGLGVLNDKAPGQSHRARLIALPLVLCQSLNNYLAELRLLADALESALKTWNPRTLKVSKQNTILLIQRLRDASTGKAPLLVRFDKALLVQPVDNDWLREVIPSAWGDIQLNFLRHRMDTKLRDKGINREMLFHQMGHLLIGAQPFGRTGMITPDDLYQAACAPMDKLLEEDGWGNIRKTDKNISPQCSLYTWHYAQSLMEEYKQLVKAERKNATRQIRTRLKRHKKVRSKILDAVIDALINNIPDFDPKKPQEGYELTDDSLKIIISQLLEDKTDNADLVEWHVDMLRSILKQYQKKHSWKCTLPARLFQPYIEPSPFFKGGLAAVQAYDALKDWLLHHFPSYSGLQKSIRANSRKDIAFSKHDYLLFRLSLLMMLVGGYFRNDRLLATLRELPTAIRLQSLPDVIVVPRNITEKGEIVAETSESLSGICSVAATALLSETAGELKIPDKAQLSAWLFTALPEHLGIRSKNKCWDMISGVVEIARRFQVSGIQHAVEADEIRQLSLPTTQLVHFADGTLPPPFVGPPYRPTRALRTTQLPYNFRTNADQNTVGDCKGYRLILTSLLYSKEGETKTFITTKDTLHPNQFKRHLLPEVRKHLGNWLKTIATDAPDIVVSLVHWANYLLSKEGRVRKNGPLRVSSTHTYISPISHLIGLIQYQSLEEMSAGDFVDIYLTLLLSKTVNVREPTLKYLIRFHHFLTEFYNVEEIDPSELYSFVGSRSKFPNPGIVTPQQFAVSQRSFDHWLETFDNSESALHLDKRSILAAQHLWTIMYRAALRVGEGHQLRHCDLTFDDGDWQILIQTTSRARLKSKAARRIVPLHKRLLTHEKQGLQSWVIHEAEQQGAYHKKNAPLFCNIDDWSLLLDRTIQSSLMTHSIIWATGNHSARPHWGRKSFVSFQILACFLSGNDFDALVDAGSFDGIDPHRKTTLAQLRVDWTGVETASNRHIAEVSRSVGHASIVTTLEYYSHLISLLTQTEMRTAWAELSIKERANIANIKTDLYRYHLSHNNLSKGDECKQAVLMLSIIDWKFRYVQAANKQDFEVYPSLPQRKKLSRSFNLEDLFKVCRKLQEGIPAKAIAHAHSLSHEEFTHLLDAIASAEIDSGYALVEKSRLMEACGVYGHVPDVALLTSRLPIPKTRPQKNRTKKLLLGFDKLIEQSGPEVNNVVSGFKQGKRIATEVLNNDDEPRRVATSVLRIDNDDTALAFINSLNKLSDISVTVVIQVPTELDEEYTNKAITLYKRKLFRPVQKLTIKEKKQLSAPRFLISARFSGENINLGNTLWGALLLISVMHKWRPPIKKHLESTCAYQKPRPY